MFCSNMPNNRLFRSCFPVYWTLSSSLALTSGHLRIKHSITITNGYLAGIIGCAHRIVFLEEERRAARGQVKNNSEGHGNQMREFRLVQGHNHCVRWVWQGAMRVYILVSVDTR